MIVKLCDCGKLAISKGKCRSCYMKEYWKSSNGRTKRKVIWNRYRKNHSEYFRKYIRLHEYRKKTVEELSKLIESHKEKIKWMKYIIEEKKHGKGSKN